MASGRDFLGNDEVEVEVGRPDGSRDLLEFPLI
jgi:hypothetical protein